VPSLFGASAKSTRPDQPVPLALGAALVALQGLVGVGIGVFFIIGGVTLGPDDPADAAMIGGMTLAMAAGLLASARGLTRRRRWARAPVLVWQLIMLGVGFSEIRTNASLAVPLIVVGLLTTVAIFHPATNAVLED
jgi:hypothetical protein